MRGVAGRLVAEHDVVAALFHLVENQVELVCKLNGKGFDGAIVDPVGACYASEHVAKAHGGNASATKALRLESIDDV